jgi:hypothetical protein
MTLYKSYESVPVDVRNGLSNSGRIEIAKSKSQRLLEEII